MFGLFKRDNKQDFVLEKFKEQLKHNGLTIKSVDEEGYYYIEIEEGILKISLENVRRNYERDKDERHITDLVDTIRLSNLKIPEKWEAAKANIYVSFYPSNFDFDKAINEPVTEEFHKIMSICIK
jgi:hypothetical protein